MGVVPFIPFMTSLKDLEKLDAELPLSPKMPVLFLGHGSPMNAIEDNEFVRGFRNIAKSLPKPNAIICVSAHYYTSGTKVTAMKMPKTIHDFGGFPKELYEVQYPAPGDPALAQSTKEILQPTPVELDNSWGLDHGAWSVIKHLYPQANIPIIQLSLDYYKTPQQHFELAKMLKNLRNKGILIIGSGNIVHNLGRVDFANMHKDNYGYDWAIEANQIFHKKLMDNDIAGLVDYEKLGSAFQLAVPTPDHYLPFIYSLGLKEKSDKVELFNDKLMAGSLSMTSVKLSS